MGGDLPFAVIWLPYRPCYPSTRFCPVCEEPPLRSPHPSLQWCSRCFLSFQHLIQLTTILLSVRSWLLYVHNPLHPDPPPRVIWLGWVPAGYYFNLRLFYRFDNGRHWLLEAAVLFCHLWCVSCTTWPRVWELSYPSFQKTLSGADTLWGAFPSVRI